MTNHSGLAQKLEERFNLGLATEVEVVQPSSTADSSSDGGVDAEHMETFHLSKGHVFQVSGELQDECRRKKLLELLEEPDLPPEERQVLLQFIADNHEAFSLDKGERGETDLVEMVIDTGESRQLKQPPRRMPFSVRQEVA